MTKQKIHSILKPYYPALHEYIQRVLPFVAVMILIRVYEYLQIRYNHSLPDNILKLEVLGLLNNIVFSLVLAGIVCIPYLIMHRINRKSAAVLFLITMTIFVVINIGLIQYFSVNLLPLGSDVYGYTLEEIRLTVVSSKGLDLLTFIPYILFTGLFVYLIYLSRPWYKLPSKWIIRASYLLILTAITFAGFLSPKSKNYNSELAYYLSSDKLQYFLAQSYDYFSHRKIRNENLSTTFEEYPYFKDFDTPNALGPFFVKSKKKPNIVLVVIEGLGRAFSGKNANYESFTPFLDSLSEHSLVWDNFLSTSGRTFGVMPALLGALPYCENGFMSLGYKMPAHLTLMQLLNEQGYFTGFYYGGDSNFDLQDVFFERQGIDIIIDENHFGPEYEVMDANPGGFSWGYGDRDVYKKSLEIINELNEQSRLDVYMTLSLHAPFKFQTQDRFIEKFEERLNILGLSREQKGKYRKYKMQYSTILYTDDALRFLINEHKKRDDFDNTIFIITGDHRLFPIPHFTKISKFHVPFIIYSDLLKSTRRFASVSTHLDVTPSLMALLSGNFGFVRPDKVHWVSDGIDASITFRNVHSVPLMRNKSQINYYLHEEYILAEDQLYKIDEHLYTHRIDNYLKLNLLQHKLTDYINTSQYVCSENKLMPGKRVEEDDLFAIANRDSLFASIDSLNLNNTELLKLAQQNVWNNEYEFARAICAKTLLNNPNYHDFRTLLGRTYSWDNQYDIAKSIFRDINKRAPYYSDAYNALIDVFIWADTPEEALEIANIGLELLPKDKELLYKNAKVMVILNRHNEAVDILLELLKMDPAHTNAKKLLSDINSKL